ncbi:aconitase family protein [Methanosarcina barkeri]|uniref:aconitase family protein n=1 Tax=Methanosarcina barkeri TaxID=2208 RepID=UPI000B02963C
MEALARWSPENVSDRDIPFIPSRVIMQDFTGVPAVVDLAALRSAMQRLGGDPAKINPVIPADLVIDHSVQVDSYGTAYALEENEKKNLNATRNAIPSCDGLRKPLIILESCLQEGALSIR